MKAYLFKAGLMDLDGHLFGEAKNSKDDEDLKKRVKALAKKHKLGKWTVRGSGDSTVLFNKDTNDIRTPADEKNWDSDDNLIKKMKNVKPDSVEKIIGPSGQLKLKDVSGEKADSKDIVRIRDMMNRADGSFSKLIQLATNMANAIDSRSKAMRRASAAQQVLSGKEARAVSKIFLDRADDTHNESMEI